MDQYHDLMARIPHGSGKAVAMSTLAADMHTTQRELRKLVQDARQHGHVIAGDRHGYYRPETLPEYKKCYLQTRHRALGTMSYLKAIQEEMQTKAMEDGNVQQMTLEEYVEEMEV